MRNTLKTVFLLASLGGLCVVAGGLMGQRVGLVIGLFIGLLLVGGSYWFSAKIAIASARARWVTPEEMPEYYEIMYELCSRADMPMPKLYVSPNPQPNAFATGRSPKNSAVCVTEGLLQVMDWNEMRGVLAHELCHIRNWDVLICSIAAAIGTAVTFVANIAMWTSGRNSSPLARLLFVFLAPMAAMLVRFAVSRSREFQADASAAELMGDGRPLVNALERLEYYSQRVPSLAVNPNQASAYIVNPLKAQAHGRSGGFLAKLFSTHPSTEKRIRRLEKGSWNR